MKRFVLVAAALLASATMSVAQNRPTFRVDANVTVSNQDHKLNNDTYDTNPNVGLRLGVGAEFRLGSKGFYLAPGLNYSMKGSRTKWTLPMDDPQASYITETSTRLHYLQLPVNVGYRFSLSDDLALSLEAGPYVAFGIGGTKRFVIEGAMPADYHSTVFGQLVGGPSNNRFDAGAGIGVALHYKRTYLQVGYEHGLVDMIQGVYHLMPAGAVQDEDIYNRSFFVGLGYRF